MIRVFYFGNLPDVLGQAMEEIALPAGVTDVAGLVTMLAARGGTWNRAFGRPEVLKITVNRQFAETGTPIRDGVEVAFVAFAER
jgi:molybdopterin synthase sulfur carrier subunit